MEELASLKDMKPFSGAGGFRAHARQTFGFLVHCSNNWATEQMGAVHEWVPKDPEEMGSNPTWATE